MARMASNNRDIFVPKIKLEQECRIYNYDLENLRVDIRPEDKRVNLWDLVRKLKEHYEKTKKLTTSGDFNAVALDKELAREKVLQIRIKNQTVLKQLIAKADAEARVVDLLNHYTELLETYIEEISESFQPEEPRRNREKLTKMFNELFEKIVKDKGEVKSWEEDGNVSLLATRVLASAKDSKEAQEYLDTLKEEAINGVQDIEEGDESGETA